MSSLLVPHPQQERIYKDYGLQQLPLTAHTQDNRHYKRFRSRNGGKVPCLTPLKIKDFGDAIYAAQLDIESSPRVPNKPSQKSQFKWLRRHHVKDVPVALINEYSAEASELNQEVPMHDHSVVLLESAREPDRGVIIAAENQHSNAVAAYLVERTHTGVVFNATASIKNDTGRRIQAINRYDYTDDVDLVSVTRPNSVSIYLVDRTSLLDPALWQTGEASVLQQQSVVSSKLRILASNVPHLAYSSSHRLNIALRGSVVQFDIALGAPGLIASFPLPAWLGDEAVDSTSPDKGGAVALGTKGAQPAPSQNCSSTTKKGAFLQRTPFAKLLDMQNVFGQLLWFGSTVAVFDTRTRVFDRLCSALSWHEGYGKSNATTFSASKGAFSSATPVCPATAPWLYACGSNNTIDVLDARYAKTPVVSFAHQASQPVTLLSSARFDARNAQSSPLGGVDSGDGESYLLTYGSAVDGSVYAQRLATGSLAILPHTRNIDVFQQHQQHQHGRSSPSPSAPTASRAHGPQHRVRTVSSIARPASMDVVGVPFSMTSCEDHPPALPDVARICATAPVTGFVAWTDLSQPSATTLVMQTSSGQFFTDAFDCEEQQWVLERKAANLLEEHESLLRQSADIQAQLAAIRSEADSSHHQVPINPSFDRLVAEAIKLKLLERLLASTGVKLPYSPTQTSKSGNAHEDRNEGNDADVRGVDEEAGSARADPLARGKGSVDTQGLGIKSRQHQPPGQEVGEGAVGMGKTLTPASSALYQFLSTLPADEQRHQHQQHASREAESARRVASSTEAHARADAAAAAQRAKKSRYKLAWKLWIAALINMQSYHLLNNLGRPLQFLHQSHKAHADLRVMEAELVACMTKRKSDMLQHWTGEISNALNEHGSQRIVLTRVPKFAALVRKLKEVMKGGDVLPLDVAWARIKAQEASEMQDMQGGSREHDDAQEEAGSESIFTAIRMTAPARNRQRDSSPGDGSSLTSSVRQGSNEEYQQPSSLGFLILCEGPGLWDVPAKPYAEASLMRHRKGERHLRARRRRKRKGIAEQNAPQSSGDECEQQTLEKDDSNGEPMPKQPHVTQARGQVPSLPTTSSATEVEADAVEDGNGTNPRVERQGQLQVPTTVSVPSSLAPHPRAAALSTPASLDDGSLSQTQTQSQLGDILSQSVVREVEMSVMTRDARMDLFRSEELDAVWATPLSAIDEATEFRGFSTEYVTMAENDSMASPAQLVGSQGQQSQHSVVVVPRQQQQQQQQRVSSSAANTPVRSQTSPRRGSRPSESQQQILPQSFLGSSSQGAGQDAFRLPMRERVRGPGLLRQHRKAPSTGSSNISSRSISSSSPLQKNWQVRQHGLSTAATPRRPHPLQLSQTSPPRGHSQGVEDSYLASTAARGAHAAVIARTPLLPANSSVLGRDAIGTPHQGLNTPDLSPVGLARAERGPTMVRSTLGGAWDDFNMRLLSFQEDQQQQQQQQQVVQQQLPPLSLSSQEATDPNPFVDASYGATGGNISRHHGTAGRGPVSTVPVIGTASSSRQKRKKRKSATATPSSTRRRSGFG